MSEAVHKRGFVTSIIKRPWHIGIALPLIMVLAGILGGMFSIVAQASSCSMVYRGNALGEPTNKSITIYIRNNDPSLVVVQELQISWGNSTKLETVSLPSGNTVWNQPGGIAGPGPITANITDTSIGGSTNTTLVLTFTTGISSVNGPFSIGFTTDQGTCSITFDPGNSPPAANDDTATTDEDVAAIIDVLANDTDPDGLPNLDPSTTQVTSAPANGTTSVNPATGAVTYTPNLNIYGSDSFVYQVCDLGGLCDTATVSVTINAVNDPPLAANDSATTNEDIAVVVNVLANDSDVEGTLIPGSVAVISGPANGGTTVNPTTGAVTYTPAANFYGGDTFDYQVCDGGGACSNASVTVSVTAVNDPPLAGDDSATTSEDTAVAIDVLANDSDPEGPIMPGGTVAVMSSPAHGSTSVNGTTGQVTYTPASNFNGADSFTYQACDSGGACSSEAAVSVTVVAVDDAPVAINDSASTTIDTPVVINVLANDSDPDGPLMPGGTVAVTSGPTSGSTSVNPTTGAITYTPSPGYTGPDAFTYQVCDATLLCATASVAVNVTLILNNPPLVNDDTATTNEDTAVVINVLGNDSDVEDGGPLASTVRVISGPAHGSTSVNPSTGAITYTPVLNFNGSDTFVYEACDSAGACDTATVSVNVNAVNDPPTANNDTATTNEDSAVVIAVLANDSDVEGPIMPGGTVTVMSGPANGSTGVNPATGAVTYTPNGNYNGSDSFTYRVCDAGGLCGMATVSITVVAVNDPPIAANDSATTNEDTAVVINVLSNDSDPDGPLMPGGAVTVTSGPSHGTITGINATTGAITYLPNLNFNSPPQDAFTYQVCDAAGACDTANVSVTVTSVNDPPVANDDTATTNEDTPVTINVLANDSNAERPPQPSWVSLATTPAHGSASIVPATGAITYTPAAGFYGSDSFTYRLCDMLGLCDTATVSVTVLSVDDGGPVAVNDTATTNEDTAVVINVLANDSDPDGPIMPGGTVSVTVPPANGTTTVNSTTGAITYTPRANFFGSNSFTYRVCDTDAHCATAQVGVTVNAVNDPPVATTDSTTTTEGTAVTINVLANDTDIDGNLLASSVTVTGAPAHGTTSVNTTTGAVTYTPSVGYVGADTFTYRVCDASGACATATVSITINAAAANTAPSASSDTATTTEDKSVTINVLSNDADAENNLSPSTVTVTATAAKGRTSVNTSTGAITYTPDRNFNGTDRFTYRVCDTGGLCTSATVSVTVTPVDDPPTAKDDTATAPPGVPTTINVVANDSDVDGNLAPGTVTMTIPAGNGSTTVDGVGAVIYTPNRGFSGSDSFTYKVCDATNLCDTALVSVSVRAASEPTRTPPSSGATPPASTAPDTSPSDSSEAEAGGEEGESGDTTPSDSPLAVEVLPDVQQTTEGGVTNLTTTLSNTSDDTLTNVTFEVTISEPGVIVGGTLPRGLVTLSPNQAQVHLDTLAPNEVVTVSFQILATDAAPGGKITACATLSADGIAPVTSCGDLALAPGESGGLSSFGKNSPKGPEVGMEGAGGGTAPASAESGPESSPSGGAPGPASWRRTSLVCVSLGNTEFCLPALQCIVGIAFLMLILWFAVLLTWYRHEEREARKKAALHSQI